MAMVKYFQACGKSQTLAFPIFSGIQNGKLSVVGQFISDGMAKALGILLQERCDKYSDFAEDVNEINLDDNGLKDMGIYQILQGVVKSDLL